MQQYMDQSIYNPCLPQNELYKVKPIAKERKQPMVNTLPLGVYITSTCQLKASFNLPFAAQSSAAV